MLRKCFLLIILVVFVGLVPASYAGKGMTPMEMAKEITAIYLEAMTASTDLVKDTPAPDAVKPKLKELKEKYIQKLIVFGKQKEKLSDADKNTINTNVRMGMMNINPETFNAFNKAQQFYLSKDKELHDLLMSFNIITQYSDFDLLKKQAPEEAKRLGITK